MFLISPLSRQSVHRAFEPAQFKSVFVAKVSAHEYFGKLELGRDPSISSGLG